MPQKKRNRATVERTREMDEQLAPPGINYLFVVAIDDYEYCPKLYNCLSDAKKIIEVLTSEYDFDPAYVFTLFNSEATEGKIFQTFRNLAKIITENDNLVIYFSGHGEYDKVFDEGYWIPVNAELGAHEDFVPNSKIKTILGAINSRHTFLIADSCFSGSLFAQFRNAAIADRLENTPSRWGLTAGRNEVVSDGKQGENSPFADSLLYHLKTQKGPLGVSKLCNLVIENVVANAEQTPRGEPLKVKGHRGGQLFFHPKNAGKVNPIPFYDSETDSQEVVKKELKKSAKQGSILYQIPAKMALGKDTKCLVRIAFDKEKLLEEIEITEDSTIKSIRISNLMEVELIDPLSNENFQIRTINEKEQIIDKEDFTQWLFYVKALKTGTFPLILKVTVIEILYGKERKKEIVLEESIKVVSEIQEPFKVAFKKAGYNIAYGGAAQKEKFIDQLETGTIKRSEQSFPPAPKPRKQKPSSNQKPAKSSSLQIFKMLGGIAALLLFLYIASPIFYSGDINPPKKPIDTPNPEPNAGSGASQPLDLRKARRGGKVGFIDNKTRELIIPYKYDQVTSFKEGVAFVKLGNKWALINQRGDLIVDFVISQPGKFVNGFANIILTPGEPQIKINTKGQTKIGDRTVSVKGYIIRKRRENR